MGWRDRLAGAKGKLSAGLSSTKGKFSGIFKKKDQAEQQPSIEEIQAQQQAQQEQPTKWERVKGGAGTVGRGLAKGAGYTAAGIGFAAEAGGKFHEFVVSGLPAVIVIILAIVFGWFFHFFYPILLIVGLIVGVLILLYHISPALTGWILFFIIAAVVVGILFGPLGKLIGFDVTTFKLLGAQSSQQAAGTQAYIFSTAGCIFGTSNCDQFQKDYSSQQASTEYIDGTKGVGVTLSNVRAARDFYADTPLEVQGVVNAKGFLGQNISAEIKATSEGIEGQDKAELENLLGALSWQCEGRDPWLIHGKLVKNLFFSCNHSAIAKQPEEGEIVVVPVKVTAKAKDTVITASKQFVLTKQETYRSGGDTPAYFYENYNSNDFASHKLGDEALDLAIRDTSDKDVLSTSANNHIEIKLENPTSHTGTANVNKDSSGKPMLYLYLPAFLQSYIGEGDFDCSGGQQLSAAEEEFLGHIASESIVKCTATRRPKLDLKPNDFFTWSLKLNVDDGFVIGDKITFNVIAYTNYYYENSELLTVDVKGTSEPAGQVQAGTTDVGQQQGQGATEERSAGIGEGG